MTSGPSRISATAFYRRLSESRLVAHRCPHCGFSAASMRGRPDGEEARDRQPPCMEAAAIDQAIAFASMTLLMVLAGLAKGRLEWHRRPPFWRRRRR